MPELAPFTYAYYELAIDNAIRKGYTFASFSTARELAASSGPVCLLRHDCDNDLEAAERLAEIEAKRGITATYFILLRSSMYNPLSESNSARVQRILSLGHELGLHFDAALIDHQGERGLRGEVDFERGILKRYFGRDVSVVSFHRPSPTILNDEIDIGCINTYSKRNLAGYQYISDSSYVMRVDLPRAMSTAFFPLLHLNTHPEWWRQDPGSVTERWEKIITDGLSERQDDLWNREDAFLQRFETTLRPAGEARELPASRYYTRYEIP